MKFYYSTATCSTVTHIALVEAGIDFQGIEVSWSRNVNVEELAKVSSLGAVPALQTDDGKTLTQNAAILEFIAKLKPEKHLLPTAGSTDHLTAIQWISFATADLQKAFSPILGAGRMTTNESAKAELKAYGLKNLDKYLNYIDANLSGKDYILGKDFSAADIALFVFIGWCKWAEVKTSPYKNVHVYMKRIFDRPAVKKVLAAEGLSDYLPA